MRLRRSRRASPCRASAAPAGGGAGGSSGRPVAGRLRGARRRGRGRPLDVGAHDRAARPRARQRGKIDAAGRPPSAGRAARRAGGARRRRERRRVDAAARARARGGSAGAGDAARGAAGAAAAGRADAAQQRQRRAHRHRSPTARAARRRRRPRRPRRRSRPCSCRRAATMSPRCTTSPGATCHSRIVPASMSAPSEGMRNSAIGTHRPARPRRRCRRPAAAPPARGACA